MPGSWRRASARGPPPLLRCRCDRVATSGRAARDGRPGRRGRRHRPARPAGLRRARRVLPAGRGCRAGAVAGRQGRARPGWRWPSSRTSSGSGTSFSGSGPTPARRCSPSPARWTTSTPGRAPSDWLERLVKAYVGDGIAADFYRAVAEVLEPGPRALVLEVLADTGHAQFAVEHVRAAIAADPKVAGRLALWARRLVGEALGQAQRVAAQRPPLACLLVPAPRSATASSAERRRHAAERTERPARRREPRWAWPADTRGRPDVRAAHRRLAAQPDGALGLVRLVGPPQRPATVRDCRSRCGAALSCPVPGRRSCRPG